MSETELIDRLRAETSGERREEILAKGWDTAVKSLYDEIRATGGHGDYQRLIFESWIIDGKDELLLEAATALQQALAERDEARAALSAETEACAASLETLQNDEIRLHMGELSAQEMRAVRAFIDWQAHAIRQRQGERS